MSKVMRSVKNVTKGYSTVQVKVREATSNDTWGPTGTQMSEIAQLTYNAGADFMDIMDMLDKRLNDKGKNWRHVLKALKVLDYCLHEGSERVVTWARQNIYIIKTLREFQYTDEEGRDVGQNVRVAAKELTALILDDERLRSERTDRRSWKSRVTGLEESAPPGAGSYHQRPRDRPRRDDEDDAEYRLAIEASKAQEEEDRRNRESRHGVDPDDEDLRKALQLSKEEEENRRRELERTNPLFDDGDLIDTNAPPQTQTQFTGFGNEGYQQGNPVDFFANPIDANQMQVQPTGYVANAYTGYQPQQTGYAGSYANGYGMPTGAMQTGLDPYGQQQQQQFQPQPTGYNPYLQQQQHLQVQSPQEAPMPAGSNNPWATGAQNQQSLKPTPTGSNNPFAAAPLGRPQPSMSPGPSKLSSLPEQKSLSTFNTNSFSHTPSHQPQPQQHQTPPPFGGPQKELTEHEARLNSLLAGGDGQDTFGNTGQLRIPAQHTAPGTFVNSAGSGINRLAPDATGSNPFLRSQFTGMPTPSYGQVPAATGPAGVNGNPFSGNKQGQSGGDLIQL
ncbi:related to clathrin binding protein ENT2 [Cephalotrichum gorgonifer]|uniref:Related to clathrin binding protein ENT2 n=1 Tax=Cephalotrichum gorgonifer TaxID=2041049 RepID=A0AAE8MQ00_9PEZI|nr:related to clathrin binding protein ENT2 [Cephalotrichum gorgonifer]